MMKSTGAASLDKLISVSQHDELFGTRSKGLSLKLRHFEEHLP